MFIKRVRLVFQEKMNKKIKKKWKQILKIFNQIKNKLIKKFYNYPQKQIYKLMVNYIINQNIWQKLHINYQIKEWLFFVVLI